MDEPRSMNFSSDSHEGEPVKAIIRQRDNIERRFVCDICYRAYVQSSSLNRHKKHAHQNQLSSEGVLLAGKKREIAPGNVIESFGTPEPTHIPYRAQVRPPQMATIPQGSQNRHELKSQTHDRPLTRLLPVPNIMPPQSLAFLDPQLPPNAQLSEVESLRLRYSSLPMFNQRFPSYSQELYSCAPVDWVTDSKSTTLLDEILAVPRKESGEPGSCELYPSYEMDDEFAAHLRENQW